MRFHDFSNCSNFIPIEYQLINNLDEEKVTFTIEISNTFKSVFIFSGFSSHLWWLAYLILHLKIMFTNSNF